MSVLRHRQLCLQCGSLAELLPGMFVSTLVGLLLVGLAVAAAGAEVVEPAERWKFESRGLTRLAISADGRHVAAGGVDGIVSVWSVSDRKSQSLEAGSHSPLTCLQIASDGLLLAGDQSGGLRVCELPGLKPVRLESPKLPVTCAAFRQANGRRSVLLGLADGRVAIIRDDGMHLQKSGHRGLKALRLNPAQTVLASAGSEGAVLLHAFEQGPLRTLVRMADHETEVAALLWSSDGTQLITGDWNGLIRIRDGRTGRSLQELRQADAVSGLCLSGQRLISGSWDGRLRIWRMSGQQFELTHEINTGRVIHDLLIEPGDTRVLTVSGTNEVLLWPLP